jgi:hypothetical protein
MVVLRKNRYRLACNQGGAQKWVFMYLNLCCQEKNGPKKPNCTVITPHHTLTLMACCGV